MGGAANKHRGAEAERAAARFLEQRGYRIRDRNYWCRYGELDLVAEKDDLLCFVEVRMTTSSVWGDPAQTVIGLKQRRVVKAALHYLQQHRGLSRQMIRFDVLSVLGSGAQARLEHIPNAFDAGM